MRHPVYPFGAVLRELRRDSGLTILAAADATAYGNYERWESGQTRVGAPHLRAIAEAFAVGDDLALLLYAWALDQLSPLIGEPARRFALDDLRDRLRLVPDTEVDLGEHKALVVEPPRHLDLTLCYLGARYRAGDGIVLPPAERAVLPSRERGTPILGQLYGDVIGDYMTAVGEALLARGIDGRTDAIDVTNIEPALEDPGVFRELADAVDVVVPDRTNPLSAWAVSIGDDCRRFADLTEMLDYQQVAATLDTAGMPLDEGGLSDAIERLMGGDIGLARSIVEHLPPPDPNATAELQAMFDRLVAGFNEAVQQQALADLQRVDASGALAAVRHLRR
jgi:transcriptional regulator with XRE-family HTH domain